MGLCFVPEDSVKHTKEAHTANFSQTGEHTQESSHLQLLYFKAMTVKIKCGVRERRGCATPHQ